VAGNGLELSIWDVERTFAASGEKAESMSTNSKRKKELEEGETWRAKNVSSSLPSVWAKIDDSYPQITCDYLNLSTTLP
jgi:hypothetical protein